MDFGDTGAPGGGTWPCEHCWGRCVTTRFEEVPHDPPGEEDHTLLRRLQGTDQGHGMSVWTFECPFCRRVSYLPGMKGRSRVIQVCYICSMEMEVDRIEEVPVDDEGATNAEGAAGQ